MYLLVFLLTLFLSLKTNLRYNNFTYLSYQSELRIYYLIWITCLSLFLLYKANKLFKKITYRTKLDKILMLKALLLMLLGSYLPYNPNNENFVSFLHVFLSSCGALLSLGIIQILIHRIILVDNSFYQKINFLFLGHLALLVMLVIMFGSINTIVELFYTYVVLFILFKIEYHFK